MKRSTCINLFETKGQVQIVRVPSLAGRNCVSSKDAIYCNFLACKALILAELQ